MNGTFTKLDLTKTLDGTWITSVPYHGSYMKVVASGGNTTEYMSNSGLFLGEEVEVVYGEYPTVTDTNPATCTIIEVNPAVFGGPNTWIPWDSLSSEYKNLVGGSKTFKAIIYDDKFETQGLTFTLVGP
jgi:hypothetical protein